MKPAVFIERDGILNLCEVKNGRQVAPMRVERFRVNLEAKPLLTQLKHAGFVVIATTNQPAISRGELPRRELDLMHVILRRGLPLDDILFCPYDEDHPCCKPQPGMFLEAAFNWSLDLDRSFVISDKWPDASAARMAGCTSIMVRSPWIGDDHHDFVVEDFASAVSKVLHLQESLFGTAFARA
jgi:D-glycero-D-manno-heptose 1,7-bisphosphate phosphatase